jgi:segregation and condensation protein A
MCERDDTVVIDIADYDGPLDLLNALLERHRVPVDRVSIASIADQYVAVIRDAPTFDMDLGSSFLLMAATLIQLKTSLLLPRHRSDDDDDTPMDPGDLLVLRLLQYRRCRMYAHALKERHDAFSGAYLKPPTSAERLGIERPRAQTTLDRDAFELGVEAVALRNEHRFFDSAEHVDRILERERVSLAERIAYVARAVVRRTRVFFYELFPHDAPPIERITGFLAVLELAFQERVTVRQSSSFAPILIERKRRSHRGT